jgi:hypothetical protein
MLVFGSFLLVYLALTASIFRLWLRPARRSDSGASGEV